MECDESNIGLPSREKRVFIYSKERDEPSLISVCVRWNIIIRMQGLVP
jgi:hypothetical protein